MDDYIRQLTEATEETSQRLSDPLERQALFNRVTRSSIDTTTTTEPLPGRRVRPRVLAAAVAVVAVAMLAVIGGSLPQTTSPAYAARELPSGIVQVVWHGELDGERLAATLREYGVDAEVETQPTSPSMVGKVVGLGPHEKQGTAAFAWSDRESSFTLDPSVFQGKFFILVNRAPRPGEQYAGAAEVFAPGEVLDGIQCVDPGKPLRAHDVARHLDRLDQEVVWSVLNSSDRSTVARGVPNGEVLWGRARDADTIHITVRLEGEASHADRSHPLDGRDCTPERAAPWR